MSAALARALVTTEAREWQDDVAADATRTEVLKLAHGQAAHARLGGGLAGPRTARPAPAPVVLEALSGHVVLALSEAGDVELVGDGIARLRQEGTGSQTQRRPHAATTATCARSSTRP